MRLDSLTMYKGILAGLWAVLIAGVVFSVTGLVSISTTGLLAMIAVLIASCYAVNELFSRLCKRPTNHESWLITALIMACIIAPSADPAQLGLAAMAGVVAMASKFLLIYRGSLIFNAAAIGVFVVGLGGSLPAIWWIATPYMLLVTVPLALITVFRHQKFMLFGVFFAAAFVVLLVTSLATQQTSFIAVLTAAIVSWPLLFLGSVLLTEPITAPTGRYVQMLYALVVGVLTTAQFAFGPLATSPLLALLVGNVFVAIAAPKWAGQLKLLGNDKITDNVRQLTFVKPPGLQFTAGQYADWTLQHPQTDIRGNRRRFSFASAPSEAVVRLAYSENDRRSSSFKQALSALQPGSSMQLGNVRGEFVLPAGSQKLLFIAGGIGITPFISMLGQLRSSGKKRDIVLLYSTASGEHTYGSELAASADFGCVVIQRDSRVTAAVLQQLVPDVLQRQVYIAGSPALVANYGRQLRGLGVKRQAIHRDEFSGY